MDTNNNSTPPTPPPSNDNPNFMAILCYLSILVIIPLVTEAKNDPFVKFHAKQGLSLLICEVVSYIIFTIPMIGFWLVPLLNLAFLVLLIIGIMNVVNRRMQELPVIGGIAKNFNF